MPSYAQVHDSGEYVVARVAFANTAATAAGSGDATEVDGDTIDRNLLGSANQYGKYNNVTVHIAGRATMASGETLSVIANFQDSAGGTVWADYGDALATTVLVTAVGGAATAKPGTVKYSQDISGAKRYVRVQVTPDLSRAGTDTATISGVLTFGGGDFLPAA